MPVESFEKGEQQVCPVCGAPYYAECEHMKHPEKFADVHGKPAKIQLGSEWADTEEALGVHQEIKKGLGLEATPEEIEAEVEGAFERIIEKDDKILIEQAVNEAVEENKNNPVIQKFLEFEVRQPKLSKEIGRRKKARESLVDSISATFEKLKPLYKDSEALKRNLKKAVVSRIQVRAEQGMFGKLPK